MTAPANGSSVRARQVPLQVAEVVVAVITIPAGGISPAQITVVSCATAGEAAKAGGMVAPNNASSTPTVRISELAQEVFRQSEIRLTYSLPEFNVKYLSFLII